MKVKVILADWKIIVRSDPTHNRLYPKSHATTILEDKKIHVRRSSLNYTVILHELIHAYQEELSYYELQLDDDQIEEWFAELFAKYGETMINDAKSVIARYKK